MSSQQLSIDNPTFHALTLLSIKNDCETLKALVPIAKNPIYSLGLLQYMALFCCATEEYCKSTGQDVDFFTESPFSISDIRCKLKLFDDRYGRTKNTISSIDDEQDEYFASLLRFKWLSRFNIHYNLGIYIDRHAYVHSELKKLKHEYPQINYAVVLAYMPGKKTEYSDYSDTMLPEGIESIHPHYAISWRNNWMLKQSDYVVTYITHSWGAQHNL